MSEAMDGRREAHMEVLVAVFGKALWHQLLPESKENSNSKIQNELKRKNGEH